MLIFLLVISNPAAMRIMGLINQKNGLSQHSSKAIATHGLQPKYRFQNRQ